MKMVTLKNRPEGYPALLNVFDDLFGSDLKANFSKTHYDFSPRVNVSETAAHFKLEFAVPGFEKKDFSISIENEYITVSGSKEISAETTEKNYTRKEFTSGSFKRMFTLPENIDAEKIDAVYENGILAVSLPKKEVKAAEGLKTIEIK